VPQGPAHLKSLVKALDATDVAIPQLVRDIGRIYLEQIEQPNAKVADLEKTPRREAQFGEETRRLQTMPGIGPITAMAGGGIRTTYADASSVVATLPPGLDSCRFSTQPAASSGSGAPRRRPWR